MIAPAIAVFARFGPSKTATNTGLIGSEKDPFFADLRVQRALGRPGLVIAAQKGRSREIAARSELKAFASDVGHA